MARGIGAPMSENRGEARYETIGGTYAQTRRTEPAIAAQIRAALGDSRSVVNVGAGAGSYEPDGIEVIAIEPSETMAAQRPLESPAIIASAEELPLADDSADAAMAVLTIHHWSDIALGLAEMRRVARDRVVVVSLEPEVMDRSWVREYAPALRAFDLELPPASEIARMIGGECEIREVMIPARCRDVFIETSLGRPELLLDPVVRANCSGFARMDDGAEARAVERLAADLGSGEWDRRYGALREMPEFDGGLRLVLARP
jgi:SAM-dependent methyltransferase